jgi:hypothetical protein
MTRPALLRPLWIEQRLRQQHAERQGLARAGLRGHQQIAALTARFEHGDLNWRGGLITARGNGFG